jgi:hypothetical protein
VVQGIVAEKRQIESRKELARFWKMIPTARFLDFEEEEEEERKGLWVVVCLGVD